MPELTGKTAIVTGGATTVGRGVVEALHRDGANVVIADIDEAGGNQVAEDFSDRVRFHRTDITDEASVTACVATAESTFGGVDLLINLACSYLDEGFASTRSQWVQALDVNVVSAACFVQAVHASMVDRGGGVVINFTSISSKVAQTGRWVYPVSKAALVQLTRNMAMDLAADGIRVNSVSPGWTWSKIMQSLTEDNRAKTDSVAAPFHLLGRVGDPIEVGNVVSFLCSEQAGFVTGADWAVDGGYSAMGPEQAVPAISQLTA